MLTLFSSSCYWSDRCFLDSNGGRWFEPRPFSSPVSNADVWTGIGLNWLRNSVGRREWRLPCVDVNVRL